jgi:hypothetical protein
MEEGRITKLLERLILEGKNIDCLELLGRR